MIHARNFASGRVAGARVVAIVEPMEEARRVGAQELQVEQAYEDYRDALVNSEVDAVVVATPSESHCEIVTAAARAGKHALCEKPMGMNVAECDAMIAAVEVASSWSLLHPRFGLVVPQPPFQDLPLAYALPLGEFAWNGAVDTWIELKRSEGTIQELYDYWILGREAEERGRRWSILRDVLHWVE